jgi:predicted nucleic acid-binding protein
VPPLRAQCVKAGHGLGQKDHEADRWVGATAMWLDIPLVAHDAIFAHVEGLTLLTKLDT